MHRLEFLDLSAFVEVAENHSFNEAAERHGTSRSRPCRAVSGNWRKCSVQKCWSVRHGEAD